MMEFGRANLMAGSMLSKNYMSNVAVKGERFHSFAPQQMEDGTVGRFFRFTYDCTAEGTWGYIMCAGDVSAVEAQPAGTHMCAGCFMRYSSGAAQKKRIAVCLDDGTGELAGGTGVSASDAGGGGSMCTLQSSARTCRREAPCSTSSSCSRPSFRGAYVDIAQPMVCLGDGPMAWAPARGEQ